MKEYDCGFALYVFLQEVPGQRTPVQRLCRRKLFQGGLVLCAPDHRSAGSGCMADLSPQNLLYQEEARITHLFVLIYKPVFMYAGEEVSRYRAK